MLFIHLKILPSANLEDSVKTGEGLEITLTFGEMLWVWSSAGVERAEIESGNV